MSDLDKRIAHLSPEKRALLMLRLKQKSADATPIATIPRRAAQESYPLSFAQQRMWFLDQLEPGSPLYSIPAAVRMRGTLDVAALERSLTAIVSRHEVLRSRYATERGHPVQRVEPAAPVLLNALDLRGHPQAEAEALRLAGEEARRPFDLTHGPLLRASLLRLADDDQLLLLTMHHVASDGWSVGVFTEELAALYGAFAAGKPSPLPEPALQYADYAAWQRERLQGELLADELAYWREQLDPAPAALELPTDRRRPAVQTFHGAHHSFALPEAATAALRELGAREEATFFMALLAVFELLLARYSGQEEFCIGTPIANRERAEIEPLIGCFVNTLVLRADLSSGPSFREVLRRVRATAIGAYAHQELPFEMLVEELKPARDLSRTPLFQVMFLLQGTPAQTVRLPQLALELIDVETGTSKFDLMLMVTEGAGPLRATFEYNTDLFDAATIERMAGHFTQLLEAAVASPDAPTAELPLLRAEERPAILRGFNATVRPYNLDRLLHELVAEQVARTPHATALRFAGEAMSFAALDARANQLAHALQAAGVGPNTLVGVFAERSFEMVIALLGVLKAGGAYVPIDPSYPAERIAMMLEDAAPPVVLLAAPSEALAALPNGRWAVIDLREDAGRLADLPATPPPCGAGPDTLAYTIFTSGSTGRPKGAGVHHRAIVNRLLWMQEEYGLGADDVVLQKTPFSFDVSVWEFFWPLLTGATLAIARPEGHKDSAYLIDLIEAEGVTTLHFVPPMLQVFLEDQGLGRCGSLRRVICSGEALPLELQERCFQRLPHVELHNLYGPTEAAVDVSYWACRRGMQLHSVPIGYPVANTQLYILDALLQPVPVGVAGELHIGGVQVGTGYVGRPDLTAEKFIADPFGEPGGRLYKTGDLARYLPDGAIEYLGRLDHQVKIRGFRIEPGEIEAALASHPMVREAVVLARAGKAGDKRLVAYLIAEGTPAPSVTELRTFLKQRLPEYMVPAAFLFLAAMPLSPSGKVDRKALPEPETERPELGHTYVAPRTVLEQYLAASWQELLELKQVGVFDNFFELGGDSLRAAVLANRVQDELAVNFHVRAIFYTPTIADLALYLSEYFPKTISERFGESATASLKEQLAETLAAGGSGARVDAAAIDTFRRIIPPLEPRPPHEASRPKNPPAVFLLSPPRSGSTLLRVMLAGHPRLFAPPELELLGFNTLQERKQAFLGEYHMVLEGTIRALMEAGQLDVEHATRLMDEYERKNLSTRELYDLLQEWIGERLLVDKTPTYAIYPDGLRRAEEEFTDARYIHLVRHPYATIYSFVEARLHRYFFRHSHPFSIRQLAELIWTVSHANIQSFLRAIPAERKHLVHYEALVQNPRAAMEGISEFLGLPFDEAMLQPYQGERMTDGIRPDAQMVGDLKFYLRKEIDSKAAERWRKFHSDDFLSAEAWRLAEELGYEREAAGDVAERAPERQHAAILPVERNGSLPLSFAQQRMWFLDQLEPESPLYNIPIALHLSGALDQAAIARSLGELIRRHEVLRTTFATEEGRPVQRITAANAQGDPELRLFDLRELPAREREAEVQRLLLAEAGRPFRLDEGPLLRPALIRLGAHEQIVLLTMHHIISDGWSAGVLIRELAALYPAFAAGRPSPLAPLPIQYADYAAWQREWLTGEAVAADLDYWRRKLNGAAPVLELPTDRPRPPVPSNRGARVPFTLPAELAQRLKGMSNSEGVTLFMVMVAALNTLLYRYSGQEDISLGTPIAGRTRAEVEPLIGCFVNTLVLRSTLTGSMSFRDLLREVQRTAADAYAHQDLPFEMLVDALQPQRDLSHTPLFQVMITMQQGELMSVQLPDLTIRNLHADSGTAKFDLTLALVDRPGGVHGALEYNSDLFDVATIKRMIGCFERLLGSVVANPNMTLDELPLLSEVEREALTHGRARTTAFPASRTLHHWFAEQAAHSPQAIALTAWEQDEPDGADAQTLAGGARRQLTYAELDARANRLAHALQARGVGPNTLVALRLPRTLDLVVAILATLKAGGAYLPIDLAYPAERVAFMLEDAQPLVLLTTRTVERDFGAADPGLPTIRLDDDESLLSAYPSYDPLSSTTFEDLAYVIYTSGSTGVPKGCRLTHANVVRLFTATEPWYGFGEAEVWTLFHSAAFDFSVWELFGALLYGGRLVVVPFGVSRDPAAFLRLLADEQVTVLNQTPSAFRQLMTAEAETGATLALRWVIFGGEALEFASLRPWFERHGDQRPQLVNMYGITETTVHVTYRPLTAADAVAGRGSAIGVPIPDLSLFVLDSRMQPVPVGVAGELFVGGAGVAAGYLNRPELTAARFVELDSLGRLYRTGDRARLLDNGDIEYLGRIDQQVKLRGFRIELGEIEAALAEHPDVHEAAVVLREDVPGARRLVAYVVPRVGAEEHPAALDLASLRTQIAARLPEYMLPAAFVELERLPLTTNGKLDRKALPVPQSERPELAASFVAPRSDVETTLARIWCEVLGLEQVGIHDTFFELGGDSILSIQVIARARAAGLQITPRQIFQHATIARLASVAGTTQVVAAEQGPVTGPAPLTPIQQWFFEQALPAPHHWNQSLLLRSARPLERATLARTLDHILIHHDALRLRFRQAEAGWEQRFDEPRTEEAALVWIELGELDEAAQRAAIEEHATAIQASLNLQDGPLLRVAYFRAGAGREDRVLFVVHHLAIDGVSWRVLLEDFQQAYAQLAGGDDVHLPAKTSSFRQWAERLSEHARSEATLAELPYWLDLAGGDAPALPFDTPGGDNSQRSTGAVRSALDEATTRALLHEVPAAYGTEINDALLTALAQALCEWTGGTNALVALEGIGREALFDDIDLSRTVGWFTTLFPVRLSLPGANDPGAALRTVKEQLRAIPRRGIGYGLLRYAGDTDTTAALRRAPLPAVSFNYLGQVTAAIGADNLFSLAMESAGPSQSPLGQRPFVLEIVGSVAGGRLLLEWRYSTQLHHAATIERLAHSFELALRALIAHCQAPDAVGYTPSDFPDADLSQAEIDALLEEIG